MSTGGSSPRSHGPWYKEVESLGTFLLTFFNLLVLLEKECEETGAPMFNFKTYLWLLLNLQRIKGGICVFFKDTKTRYVDVNDPINNFRNN